MKKKTPIAPLIFFLFLLLPLLGSLLLQTSQVLLKRSAETRMKSHPHVRISLPGNAVRWEKKDKELRINGALFDVKKYTLANGILTAVGYYDKDENWVEYLLSFVAGKEPNSSLLHLFLVLQCFPATIILFRTAAAAGSRFLYFLIDSFFFPKPLGLILEQPPRRPVVS